MSSYTGLNLGSGASSQNSKPTFAPQPVPRNPALAFLLSLLLPGLGQFYCRKNSRAVWTLLFFIIGLGATVWLTLMLPATGLDMIWGILFRVAVFLYVFAFLDAYFTAREMTAGTDAFIAENPRVAAILNLLTRGFGYFYLGHRAAGFGVFIGVGIFQQIILAGMKSGGRENEAALGLFMEVILAGLAVDAYHRAKKSEKEILATIQPAPQPRALGGLPPAVPIALAIVFGIGYLGLNFVGFALPDYSTINQSPARISEEDQEVVYTNPDYGVVFRAPATWSLADQDTKRLVSARRKDNVCAADLRLGAWSPILSLSSYAKVVSANLERPDNKGSRLVQSRPTHLGGLAALDIMLAVERQGDQVTEHQIAARRGMTLYVLTTDSLTDSVSNCGADFRLMQQRLTLPK